MKVLYSLRTSVPSIKLNGQFDLTLLVSDLREPGSYTYDGRSFDLIRGVFAAYCDILFDKSMARVCIPEVQLLSFAKNYGTAHLSLGAKTTRPISYDKRTKASRALTATNIQTGLNTMLAGAAVNVLPVNSDFRVSFTGQPNIDEPILKSSDAPIVVKEIAKGGDLGAYFSAFTFSETYPNDKRAYDRATGIHRVGAFASSFGGLGGYLFEVMHVRMQATKLGSLTFTPDFMNLVLAEDDTLVYGNIAADPPEESVVDISDIQIEPVTISIIA